MRANTKGGLNNMPGIYIHVPYCNSKCHYCDFYSGPQPQDRFDAFVDSLFEELQERQSEIPDSPSTLYIGGGTPSILSGKRIAAIVGHVAPKLIPGAEITVEVNPEDVTDAEMALYAAAGVNRISMGIQSFDDAQLKDIGRRHSAGDAIRAVDAIRSAGISNISCDLIYGLPDQSTESWKLSLDRLMSMDLPHFSAYLLSYEPGTRLYAKLSAGKIRPAGEDTISEMYSYLCRRASEEGYEHYEISNFARPGMRSRHNSSYWHDEPYIGLGPSAVSFDGKNSRRTNHPDMKAYISGDRKFTIEEENEVDRVNDAVLTGLRTSDGLNLERLPAGPADRIRREAQKMLKLGLLRETDHGFVIPEEHFLVSDMIIRELMI